MHWKNEKPFWLSTVLQPFLYIPCHIFCIIVSFALAAFILYRPGEIKSLFS